MTKKRNAGRMAGLVLGAWALGMAAPAAAQEEGADVIRVELNKLDAAGPACRPYLLFENGAAEDFTELQMDLVLFDTDGVVADRLAVDAAPLPAGKTSLVVFEVASMTCADVGRILVNAVIACAGGPATPAACLDRLSVHSRIDVPLFK